MFPSELFNPTHQIVSLNPFPRLPAAFPCLLSEWNRVFIAISEGWGGDDGTQWEAGQDDVNCNAIKQDFLSQLESEF